MGAYHDTLTFATAPAARGQGVVVFYRRTDGLKDWKNGGFRADPLAKTPPFLFSKRFYFNSLLISVSGMPS